MKLYMAVTAAKYELPIYIADTKVELTKAFGLKQIRITDEVNGRNKGRKFIRVICEEGE